MGDIQNSSKEDKQINLTRKPSYKHLKILDKNRNTHFNVYIHHMSM
jgi:hypothetical protein